MTIKAIETKYNGYRFRSRLEARWAVFFDLMRIPYHYELQGYEVRGRAYLPDFIIYPNDNGPWIEIKGFTPKQADIDVIESLSIETRKWTILFVGDPFGIAERYEFIPGEWNEYINPQNLHDQMLHIDRAPAWMENIIHMDEQGFVWGFYADSITEWGCNSDGKWIPMRKPRTSEIGDKSKLLYAQLRARQARFEHGETPRIQGLM